LFDESSVTGESDEIKKNNNNKIFILSGTIISQGNCEYCSLAVGSMSQINITRAAGGEAKETPLQEKLNQMATHIG